MNRRLGVEIGTQNHKKVNKIKVKERKQKNRKRKMITKRKET
jgi:hypothetical protein